MRHRLPRSAIVVVGVVVVLVAARLALDPLVAWRTRVILSRLEGLHATFSAVEVRLSDLSYGIRELRIEKETAGGARLPFFEVRQARFGLYWKELLRGHLVAAIDLDAPRLNVVQKSRPAPPPGVAARGESQRAPPPGGQQIEEAPQVGERLTELAPFRVDRMQVRDGQITFVEARQPRHAVLRLHHVEATIENFATRPALAKAEPTVLAARGVLQESGRVSVFATADPLAKHVTFAGEAKLDGLRLVEIAELVAAKSRVEPERGTLDLSVRFEAVDGRITGGVRPILKGASTKPARGGLRAQLESLIADSGLHLFSDDVPGRNAVATTIPIAGSVKSPKAQAVPTIVGVLRNAFVRGLADSLAGLPPPKAKEKESTLEQARRGLSPRSRPRAQPEGKR
jgi:hypothetical protein